MKKLLVTFAISLINVALLTSCASSPKVKDISGPTEIIEHKGTAFGVATPQWVADVIGTPNQKNLQKTLGIKKHIWVVTKSGENLNFIKTWADQVDARAEIAASIQQGVADFVGAKMEGDGSDVEENIKRYSARASAISISGLNKETDWWVRSRTRIQKKNNEGDKYTYIVIYSMDENLYAKQIKKAFNGEDDKVVNELIEYLMNYTMVEAKD